MEVGEWQLVRDGVRLRELLEGSVEAPTPGELSPLSPVEISQMLPRLPDLPTQESLPDPEISALPLPEAPVPIGQLAPTPIGAEIPGASQACLDFRVEDYGPQGLESTDGQIWVQFSQPVIDLTTLDNAAQVAPLLIQPECPGAFRWVEPSRLVFEPAAGRFPLATPFSVELRVPVRSLSGQELTRQLRWEFTTPRPRVMIGFPIDTPRFDWLRWLGLWRAPEVERGQVFLLVFNGPIDTKVMFSHLRLTLSSGGPPLEIRQVEPEELTPTSTVHHYYHQQPDPSHCLLFTHQQSLPDGAHVRVALTSPFHLREGSLPSLQGWRGWFRSPSPFRFTSLRVARLQLTLRFSHLLLERDYKLVVSPALSDQTVEASGYCLLVRHTTILQPGQVVEVELPADLADQWGRPLTGSTRVRRKVDPDWPSLELAPDGRLLTTNVHKVEVVLLRQRIQEAMEARPPQEVWSQVIKLPERVNQLQETTLDLPPLAPVPEASLEERFIWSLQAYELDRTGRGYRNSQIEALGCQLGVSLGASGGFMDAWVVDRFRGRPLPNVHLQLNGLAPAITNEHGLARFPYPPEGEELPDWLMAWTPSDTALLKAYVVRRQAPEWRWWVADDRGLYRPGESLSLKGWVRRADLSGNLHLPEVCRVLWQLFDGANQKVEEGELSLSPMGGFHLSLQLPQSLNLGYAHLSFALQGNLDVSCQHPFKLEEFRRPEARLSLTVTPGPLFLDQTVRVQAQASYYSGEPLVAARVKWRLKLKSDPFPPTGWNDFHFPRKVKAGPELEFPECRANAQGKHGLELQFTKDCPVWPCMVRLEVEIQDDNLRVLRESLEFLVHNQPYYLGLRGRRGCLEAIVVDPQDRPVEGVLIYGSDETIRSGLEPIQLRRIEADRRELVSASIEVPGGGRVSTECMLCGEWLEEGSLFTCHPEGPYRPGDQVELRLRLTAPGGWACFHGLGQPRVVAVDGHEARASFTLGPEHIPQVLVCAQEVSPAGKVSEHRVLLSVPPTVKELNLLVECLPEVEPGQEVEVEILVQDFQGRACPQAEVAIFLADSAVFDAGGQPPKDPMPCFYPDPPSWCSLADNLLYDSPKVTPSDSVTGALSQTTGIRVDLLPTEKRSFSLLSAVSNLMTDRMSSPSSSWTPSASGPAPQLQLRQDFRALAGFEPCLTSDEQGRVRARFRLPDSLTEYRITALAAGSEGRFGQGQATVRARLPLALRPTLPRFLRMGDECLASVVVTNQTQADLEAVLVARSDRIGLPQAGFHLQLGAGQRQLVPLALQADQWGKACLQMGLFANQGGQDGAQLELPIHLTHAAETIGLYGEMEQDQVQSFQVVLPPELESDFGGLEVKFDSTLLGGLSQALLYLTHYPFVCTEQLASRVLGLVVLSEVLQRLGCSDLPPPAEIRASVERDLDSLARRQHPQGSFPVWPDGKFSLPFFSVHAIRALATAQRHGYAVDPGVLAKGLSYLEQPSLKDLPVACLAHSQAYGLFVLRLLERPQPKAALRLLKRQGVKRLDNESLAWLLGAMQVDGKAGRPFESARAGLRRALLQRLEQTASTAQLSEPHLSLWSAQRAQAAILESLLLDSPDHKVAPKLVRALLGARQGPGRWANTQENVFVLIALERYFRTRESVDPHLLARCWLGERTLLAQSLEGYQAGQHKAKVGMRALSQTAALTLEKKGTGRLYYRVALEYAPKSGLDRPVWAGLQVSRTYAQPAEKNAEGVWEIEAGQTVRVVITLRLPGARYHLAVVDPLPAGFEVVSIPGSSLWDHCNARDDRVEFFASHLPPGFFQVSYLARASCRGLYTAPPARAEEMYAPETFGRSPADRVMVR
ncbi:MAG: alpha-2-macroglobulin family protein [Vulcanimicrobiota bacterium]